MAADCTIREAGVDDLPQLVACAEEFYASSRFLKGFELERFCTVWGALLSSGMGVVFVIDGPGGVTGTIGGVAVPDLYAPGFIATEFFWFVRPELRGEGMKLYHAFEEWARSRGCKQIRMVHLMDSMPEQLQRVYARLGYEAAEIHYVKELA